MRLKVGDIVRVKTYKELNSTTFLYCDWSFPYVYSQGVKGKIRKIEKSADGKLKIFLYFNLNEMFAVNPCNDEDIYNKQYILEENEKVSFSINEIIFEKNLELE